METAEDDKASDSLFPAKSLRFRPVMRDLSEHVIQTVAQKWYDVGLQLLDPKYDTELDTIEDKYHGDNQKCCRVMFRRWLETSPDASWEQLIAVLEMLGFATLACTIKRKAQDFVTERSDLGAHAEPVAAERIQVSDEQAEYVSMLVNITELLDNPDVFKCIKRSLRYYHVKLSNKKQLRIDRDVIDNAKTVEDVIDNLQTKGYLSIDNVDILIKLIVPGIERQFPQIHDQVKQRLEDYKEKKHSALITTSPKICRRTLPNTAQYVVATTRQSDLNTVERAEEIGEQVFSTLGLPKFFSWFCGIGYGSLLLYWELHDGDYLEDYVVSTPDYDHLVILKQLEVVKIEVVVYGKEQEIDLSMFNYVGCLLHPKTRVDSWQAWFICLPYNSHFDFPLEEVIGDSSEMLDWQMAYMPVGFDQNSGQLSLTAPEQYVTFLSKNQIDRSVVDQVTAEQMYSLLPKIHLLVHDLCISSCTIQVQGCYLPLSFDLTCSEPSEVTKTDVSEEMDRQKTFLHKLWNYKLQVTSDHFEESVDSATSRNRPCELQFMETSYIIKHTVLMPTPG